MLGDLIILSLYPTDEKSKIAAKYTSSVFSVSSSDVGQAGSVEKTEAVDWAKKNFIDLFKNHVGNSPRL